MTSPKASRAPRSLGAWALGAWARAGKAALARSALFVVLPLATLLVTSAALAEPVVTVHVRRAGATADGTVTVTDADGRSVSCETVRGECTLRGLTAGRHRVVAVGPDGQQSEPRAVMLPPDGEVSLFVSVP